MTADDKDKVKAPEVKDEPKAPEVKDEPKAPEVKDEPKAPEVKDEPKAPEAPVEKAVEEKSKRVKVEQKVRTSDSDDPDRDWTAQDGVPEHGASPNPGATFKSKELPDRKVVEAAGIDYDVFVERLTVEG